MSAKRVGELRRHVRRTGFKIALVISPAPDTGASAVCQIWMANSRKWTQRMLIPADQLVSLSAEDRKGARKHTIARAAAAAIALGIVDTVDL